MTFEIIMPPSCSECNERALYWTGKRYVCYSHYNHQDYADICEVFPDYCDRVIKAEWKMIQIVDPVTFDEGEG